MTSQASKTEGGDDFRREVTIQNELGLHARAAAKIVAVAKQATHGVWLAVEENEVNAKSTMDILTLNRPRGSRLMIRIEKKTDIEILSAIVRLIDDGFGESN